MRRAGRSVFITITSVCCLLFASCNRLIEQTEVIGRAFTDEALTSASVRIITPAGTATTTTAPRSGTFSATIPQTSGTIRIEVEGLYKSRPVKLLLTTRETVRPARVSLVSTLVTTYLDKHPETSLEDAERQIRLFLRIPPNHNYHLGLSSVRFHAGEFVHQAEAQGGINVFMEQLLAEMDAGQHHAFSGQVKADSTGSAGLLKGLVTSIAGAGLKAGSSAALGWTLQALNLGQGDQLNDIQKHVIQISETVNEIKSALQEDTDLLSAKVSQDNYNTVYSRSVAELVKNNKLMVDYLELLSHFKYDTEEERQTALRTRNLLHDLVEGSMRSGAFEMWNDALLGSSLGNEGLIQAWDEFVNTDNSQVITQAMAAKIQRHWDVVDMELAQTLLFSLEYYHEQFLTGEVDANTAAQIKSTVKAWATLRKNALDALRGGTKSGQQVAIELSGTDFGEYSTADYQGHPIYLPRSVIIDKARHQMWSTVPALGSAQLFDAPVGGMHRFDFDVQFNKSRLDNVEMDSGVGSWRFATCDDLRNLQSLTHNGDVAPLGFVNSNYSNQFDKTLIVSQTSIPAPSATSSHNTTYCVLDTQNWLASMPHGGPHSGESLDTKDKVYFMDLDWILLAEPMGAGMLWATSTSTKFYIMIGKNRGLAYEVSYPAFANDFQDGIHGVGYALRSLDPGELYWYESKSQGGAAPSLQ